MYFEKKVLIKVGFFKGSVQKKHFWNELFSSRSYFQKEICWKKTSFEIEIFEYVFFSKRKFFLTEVFLKEDREKKERCKKKRQKENVFVKKCEKVFLFRRCPF